MKTKITIENKKGTNIIYCEEWFIIGKTKDKFEAASNKKNNQEVFELILPFVDTLIYELEDTEENSYLIDDMLNRKYNVRG